MGEAETAALREALHRTGVHEKLRARGEAETAALREALANLFTYWVEKHDLYMVAKKDIDALLAATEAVREPAVHDFTGWPRLRKTGGTTYELDATGDYVMGYDPILLATEAVREPAVREPRADPLPIDLDEIEMRWASQWNESDDGEVRAWRADVAALIDEVRRLSRVSNAYFDEMVRRTPGSGPAWTEYLAAHPLPALREHEGRDAEVAGPPQIDVERLARAMADDGRDPSLWDLLDEQGRNVWRTRAGYIATAYARLASTDKPEEGTDGRG